MKFAITNRILDTSVQDGFVEKMNGYGQHAAKLRNILEKQRRDRNALLIIWLDIRNAYGSVCHDCIKIVLSKYKILRRWIDYIMGYFLRLFLMPFYSFCRQKNHLEFHSLEIIMTTKSSPQRLPTTRLWSCQNKPVWPKYYEKLISWWSGWTCTSIHQNVDHFPYPKKPEIQTQYSTWMAAPLRTSPPVRWSFLAAWCFRADKKVPRKTFYCEINWNGAQVFLLSYLGTFVFLFSAHSDFQLDEFQWSQSEANLQKAQRRVRKNFKEESTGFSTQSLNIEKISGVASATEGTRVPFRQQ